MKTTLGLATIALLFATALCAQRIKGSDTVLPLSQLAAERFMKLHPNRHTTVTGGGSGVGISALLTGNTEIAQASRRIKFDEKQKLKAAGKEIVEVVAAYDALAVVVHPSNPVKRLTREQLEGIFMGRIKNWKEVGGCDLRIIPYARETSSGTYELFRENVLKHKNYMSGIMSMPATGAIVQSVGQTPGAIGYIGLAYLTPRLKAIDISYDQGRTYVSPTFDNARRKLYPIIRPLYFYYEAANAPKVRNYLDYLLSPAGQRLVEETGFVAVQEP